MTDRRPNLRTVFSPLLFVREVLAELKNVTWPTLSQTAKATLVVIVVSLAVGLYIAGLDLVFTKGIGLILEQR